MMRGIFKRTLYSLYLGQRVEGEVNDVQEPHIQTVAKRLTDQDESNQHLGYNRLLPSGANKCLKINKPQLLVELESDPPRQ